MTFHVTRWAVPPLLGLTLLLGKLAVELPLAKAKRPEPIVDLETARFHSRSLHKFSLGFDNLLADLTWIAVVQNASHEPLDHSGVSWEYAMLNSIHTLDPAFERPYVFGAAFVSIFRRDKTGAKDLLEKWVSVKPNSWLSHYKLGFHLFHEMGDHENAAKHILRAASLPNAPPWLGSLGVRLLSESGSLMYALQTATQLYATVTHDEAKDRLKKRIRSLNYALQKLHLEEALRRYRSQTGRSPAALSEVRTSAQALSETTRRALLDFGMSPEVRALLGESFQFRYDSRTAQVTGILDDDERYLETVGIHSKEL